LGRDSKVDTKVNPILDRHLTTTRKHDSQITPSFIEHNFKGIDILFGDKATTTRKSGDLLGNTRFGH